MQALVDDGIAAVLYAVFRVSFLSLTQNFLIFGTSINFKEACHLQNLQVLQEKLISCIA